MNRESVSWRGFFAAAPTPFSRSGIIDYDSLRELLSLYLAWGVHGVIINGTTGEWPVQTLEERRHVVAAAAKHLAGRVPLLAGVTCLSRDDTVELAKHAASVGAEGVVISAPPVGRLAYGEVIGYYGDLCRSIALPVMLYNGPNYYVTDMSPSTIEELSRIPNVVAIKDSRTDDLIFFETVRRAGDKLRIFGNLLSPIGASLLHSGFGGDGYVDAGCMLGRLEPAFFEAVWKGDVETASRIGEIYAGFMKRIQPVRAETNTISLLKAVMAIANQPGGYPRWPRRAIEDVRLIAELKNAMLWAQVALPER